MPGGFEFLFCGGAAFLVVIALAIVVLYNRLVVLRNRVQNAWSQIDVQLKPPLRSHPESRRDRQGIHDARGGDAREGHPGAQHGH
jgi:hypothetical protein